MALAQVDPSQYEAQLARKQSRMQTLFERFNPPAMELYRSEPTNYRMRAEFRVWHDGDDLDYVMFEPGNKTKTIKISECPMVDSRIESMMFDFLAYVREVPELRRRLFQVDFLATLSGELLVSMLYHRAIDEAWVAAARPLREQFGIDIVGRSRKKKIVLDRDFVFEKLHINGRQYTYKQTENSFTQPNARVCEQMVEWAIDATRGPKEGLASENGDLVEFYCGNGNFTLPLAQNFRQVVATEISKESVRAAQVNIEANAIDNVAILRLSSEEFTQVLRGNLTTRRTESVDLSTCNFRTVLVDPPRAGLDEETVKEVQGYDDILYISCNPETLAENLDVLCQTHHIERFALFDQFPYTDHIECGVVLKRKAKTDLD